VAAPSPFRTRIKVDAPRDSTQQASPSFRSQARNSQGGGVSSIAAYEKRERNFGVQRRLAQILNGYHARIVRLFLQRRKPQAALDYIVLLPQDIKLHGSLINEIAKHSSFNVLEEALRLRELLDIPMDR
jgi:hypothetical protein